MGRLLGIALVAIAGAGLMIYGYTPCEGVAFYSGVLLVAVSSGPAPFLLLRRLRSPALLSAGMAVSLFLCFFVLLEIGWRLRGEGGETDPEPVYSFAAARGDPEAFRRWWDHYVAEFKGIRDIFLMPDPRGALPFVQRPGSSGRFFKSEVRINGLGFRGPEIARQKGDRYRIVVLGCSTTWGSTIRSDDTPWPEILARRITNEFACAVPVEVINAGMPGFPLSLNLLRLEDDIRPLAPNLVITYHGPEGFDFIGSHPAPEPTDVSAIVDARPSKVLGAVEGALRRWQAGRRDAGVLRDYLAARRAEARGVEADLLATPYAALYRRLAVSVAAWPAKLIMCTYNLAVTEGSPEKVIRFYERGFPNVRALVVANRLHNRLVSELGRKENILVIDTAAGLDGAYEDAYADVFHHTQVGSDRLAANVLTGLISVLADDPRARCRPAAGGLGVPHSGG